MCLPCKTGRFPPSGVGIPELSSASHVCHCKSFGNPRSFCPFLHLHFPSICSSSSRDTRLQAPWEWQLPASQPLTAASQLPKLLTASQICTGSVTFWPSTPGSLCNSHLAISCSFSAGIFLHTLYYDRDMLPGRFVVIPNRPKANTASPGSCFQTSLV